MPFTAHDLRHKPEQSYPLLYAYLHRNAQRFLGPLKYDAFEVDMVVGHVIEQLVRLGLLGGGNTSPQNALDTLTDAQFYAFLSRSVRNKAIDRLRKRRLQVSTIAELEKPDDPERSEDTLDEAVGYPWSSVPFATPEELTIHLVSQLELRNMLKHCIMGLGTAPHQLQAIIQELEEVGADDLLQAVFETPHIASTTPNAHLSQHKDHAHKKLRHCLQQHSTNLIVTIALRLTEYGVRSAGTQEYATTVQTLAQHDLTMSDVRTGLHALVAEGLLTWQDEETIFITAVQMKHLQRFYREE